MMYRLKNNINNREYIYDNIRFLLIILVILGHGMELMSNEIVLQIYCIIYSFHMPFFIFITGRFAKFDKKKIGKHFILTYIVFQTIYLLFNAYFLSSDNIRLQYTTPYWILWYLMSIVFYYLLIPLLPSKDKSSLPYIFLILVCSVIISLLVGYEPTIGVYLSLSRTFVFLPFFVCGYYSKIIGEHISSVIKQKVNRIIIILLFLVIVFAGEFYLLNIHVSRGLLYGYSVYSACGADIFSRLVILITASAWIGLLLNIIPNIHIPLITTYGQRTMPIYVLHGFIIKILGKYNILHYSVIMNLLILTIITMAFIIIAGNKKFYRIFSIIF